jgi:plastocyanin
MIRHVAIAVIPLLLPCAGLAADRPVTQKGRTFSPETLTIRKGDTITFVNDDNVPHNAMSTSPGNEFNIGGQRPGEQTPVTFTQAGDVKIDCAIHPRMRLQVKVTP